MNNTSRFMYNTLNYIIFFIMFLPLSIFADNLLLSTELDLDIKLTLSPDSKIYTTQHPSNVFVWSLPNHQLLNHFYKQDAYFECAFDSFSNQLGIRHLGFLKILHIENGRYVQTDDISSLDAYYEPSMFFSHDWKYIITAHHSDKSCKIWDTTTGDLLTSLYPVEGYITAATQLGNQNRIIAGDNRGFYYIFDMANGELLEKRATPASSPPTPSNYLIRTFISHKGKYVATLSNGPGLPLFSSIVIEEVSSQKVVFRNPDNQLNDYLQFDDENEAIVYNKNGPLYYSGPY